MKRGKSIFTPLKKAIEEKNKFLKSEIIVLTFEDSLNKLLKSKAVNK